MKRTVNLPLPYPDETCYSILSRFAVRRGWQSTHQVCQELFRHNQPLDGYIFKPFRKTDVDRWQGNLNHRVHYGERHSCYQYMSVMMPDHILLRKCVEGSVLSSGKEQGIIRRSGLTKIRKKHLWYCVECVKEDMREYGETCWRRLPQMPGVSYCPIHERRLKESGVSFDDIKYRIIPATYAMDHIPEPETDVTGNMFKNEYIRVAHDMKYLLDHGSEMPDNEAICKMLLELEGGRRYTVSLFNSSERKSVPDTFEHHLAARILKEQNRNRLDIRVHRSVGLILMIEKHFGSMKAFMDSGSV